MTKCLKCKRTGLKLRDMNSAVVDGVFGFVCKECSNKLLGEQNPSISLKK